MREWWRDAVLAARVLAKDRGSSVALVLTFALAVGINAAAFGLVSALFLRPLPVEAPQRIVQLVARSSEPDAPFPFPWSYPDYVDYRESLRNAFSAIALIGFAGLNEEHGGHVATVRVADVSWNFFQAMGIRPLVGRTFLPADESLAASPYVAVVSSSFSSEELGGQAIGGTIRLNNHLLVVVGVVDERDLLAALGNPQIFVPSHVVALLAHGNSLANREARWARVFGRMAPGVPMARVQASLLFESRRLAEEHPLEDRKLRVTAVPAGTLAGLLTLSRDQPLRIAKALWAIALLVLLIACANCADISATRGIGRLHEMAVRLALGASRPRLAQQLAVESLLLCSVGAALGYPLARLGLAVLRLFPDVARFDPKLDLRVAALALALTAAATFLFGLACLFPAIHASPASYLQTRRSEPSHRQKRLRQTLVTLQVALTVALLWATGIVLHSLATLESVDLGFDPSSLLVSAMDFSSVTGGQLRPPPGSMLDRLRRRVLLVPGVKAVGFATATPLDGIDTRANILVPGYGPLHGQRPTAHIATVGDHYLSALGIRIVRGRGFGEAARTETAAVIVSRAAAERYWAGRNPIGREAVIGGERVQVIGVASDVRQTGPSGALEDYVYYRYPAGSAAYVEMLVHATGKKPEDLEAAVERCVHDTFPGLPGPAVESMDERLQTVYAPQRIIAWSLGTLGALGLLLSSVGLYALLSYEVASRHRELCVRMALGASPGKAVRMIFQEALRVSAVGFAVGVATSFVAIQWLRPFASGVSPVDPASVLGALALALAAAIVAGAAPAVGAGRANLARGLREE